MRFLISADMLETIHYPLYVSKGDSIYRNKKEVIKFIKKNKFNNKKQLLEFIN